jgi:acetyl esterase/lipase
VWLSKIQYYFDLVWSLSPASLIFVPYKKHHTMPGTNSFHFTSTRSRMAARPASPSQQLSFKGALCILLLLLLYVISFSQPCQCGNGRYVHSIFGNVMLGTNVQYTQNAGQNFDGTTEQERMDIWGPANDNCNERPLIIWVHGGGFAQQDKTAPDMVAMCDSFSRHGFVCATIDYRDDYWGPYGPVNDYSQNPTPYDNLEFSRADYRAMQDAKCAVRYFKANASLYGIDTNFIFMGGTSAGAWTSLMVAYLNKTSEKLPAAYPQSSIYQYARPDLGSIEGNGGWSTYSSKVRAIIDCWGAIPDTSLIDGPSDPAAIIFHEYGDPVVNYYYGPPFQGQFQNFDSYWGTEYVNMQMNAVNVDHRTFSINGNQHSLYPYRGLVTSEVSGFLDSIICTSISTHTMENTASLNSLTLFPNPAKSIVNVKLFVRSKYEIILYDVNGREVRKEWVAGDELTIDISGMEAGIYLLKVSGDNFCESKRLVISE